jgi:metallo-beta-lactamase class B
MLRTLLLFVSVVTVLGPQVVHSQSPRVTPNEPLPPIMPPFAEGVPKEIDNRPFPAHRIADDLYYVGTADFASFLITTPAGHILVNPNWVDSVPLIEMSMRNLGFSFEDIRIVLNSHAHIDHVEGTALIQARTDAQVVVMDRDVEVMERGGEPGTVNRFPPVTVDRIIHDNDVVEFGGQRLVAHLTPGHTKGCTTWTFQVRDGQKLYNVVIVGSANVNNAQLLLNNAAYPDIIEDFVRSFRVLKQLPADIFLASHGKFYGMMEKHARLQDGQANPFVDPDGYRAHVALMEKIFYYRLDWASRRN